MKKHHLTAAIQNALMPARAETASDQPAADNQSTRSWYTISALAGSEPTVEIYIYDVIGYWGVSAQQFISDCKAAGVFSAKQINLHIHSPGGDVMDGFAIYNTLARLTCKIDIWNDGLAASMASVILCLPNATVHMPSNAWVMIHKPWSGAVGNADDLRDLADWLDRNEALLLNAYEKKTGKPREELAALLSADTWLDGLQDLRLDEMADAAFRHDRDGDGLLDALDHRGIAHARDAAGRADVGGDALERHDGAGAGGLGNLRLLRRRDVHDDAALEHLGELLVEFILILLLVFCHLRQLLCMKGKAGPFPGEARFFASAMCFS